jgi:FkbM family methyltransferase
VHRTPIVGRLLNLAIRFMTPLLERLGVSNLRADLVALAADEVRVIFDVGANVGQSAVSFAAMFPRASIFAFEPLPRACQAIEALRIPQVEVIEAAVGASTGSAVLHVNADSQTSSLLTPNLVGRELFGDMLEERAQCTVPVTSIDDFCAARGITAIDVLKIDAQGSELLVLEGAKRTLPRCRIIQVEANFVAQYEGSATFGEVDAYLRDRGWEFYNMYQLWRDPSSRRLVFANCLYFNTTTAKG